MINSKELSEDKDEIIKELKEEDKRLNGVILNLHGQLNEYNKKIQKQKMIIDLQWSIISTLIEFKTLLEDDDDPIRITNYRDLFDDE